MGQVPSKKRPWLAALLALLVTGLGHLYLKQWRRAAGWLAVMFGVGLLLVDPAVLEALAQQQTVDLLSLAPVLLVGCLSVADAYLLARAHNTASERSAASERTACPNCGKELDTDLGFCHWCSTEIEADAAS